MKARRVYKTPGFLLLKFPPCFHFKIGWFTLLLIVFIGLSSQSGQAQNPEKFNFKYVEQKSYALYSTGQWDDLLAFGKEAIRQGHDYYYLRLRLGIACYYNQDYALAIFHLKKARRFNAADHTPIQYLYLSYVYSHRDAEANALYFDFPNLQQDILAGQKPRTGSLYFESGLVFSNNLTKNKSNDPAGEKGILGVQDLNGDKFYGHIGWKSVPSKNILLYAGIDFLNTTKLQNIQTSQLVKTGYDTILHNGWYYVDTLYGRRFETAEYSYPLKQRSVYVQTQINLGNGFNLTPAVRLLFINYTSQIVNDTLESYFAQSYDTIPSTTTNFSVSEHKTRFANYVFSLNIGKHFRKMDYSLFGSFSKLNYQNQYQAGAGISWYPFGNLNLYSRSQGISHYEANKNMMVFDQVIGVKLSPKIWFEGSLRLGQWKNYSFDNAFVVYNSGDKAQYRMGANIILPLSNRLEISVRYQNLKFEGMDEWYDEAMGYHNRINKYNNNLIIGGLQWKL